MKRTNYIKLVSGITGTTIVLACGMAQAQTAPAASADSSSDQGGLADIIVTAQRKSERLQDVPISVNVISGEDLTSRGITNTEELPALVPGLTFTSTGPAGTVYLRGIGSNAGNPNDEPSVATYVDGVYIASSFSNMLNLADVDHVEVLKGPQGTLFGRNATGGVIQIITRDPQQTPELEVSGTAANYGTGAGSLYATTGITDTLAVDISAQGSDQTRGWGHNVYTGLPDYRSRDYSFRTKFLFTPIEHFRATLSADYEYSDTNTVDYRLPPGILGIDGMTSPANLYDTRSYNNFAPNGEPAVSVRQFGTALNLKYESGFADFVSISAYRHGTGDYYPDADATPLEVVGGSLPIYQSNYSEELQMLSPANSKIDWTVGLYYYNNAAGYQNIDFQGLAFATPAFSSIADFRENAIQYTQSFAEYAQVSVPVTSSTKLTAGIRDTDERQKADDAVFGSQLPITHLSFNRPTWRLAADQSFTDDVHTFFSYNRGVKGGGFDLLTPGSTGFRPESVDAYELGAKTNLFDRRLRFNASVFDDEYKNIQVQVVPAGSGGIISTTNAARARIKGVDTDFETVPFEHMTISGGAAYLDGKYLNFENTVAYTASPLDPRPSFCSSAVPGSPCLIDASGNPTIHTPRWTANMTAAYEIPSKVGKFPVSLTASYNSGFAFSTDDRLLQPSYTLINAAAGWVDLSGKYSVTFWGSNLADKYYLAQAVPSSLGNLTTPSPPRTYGITLKAKFGG